MENTNDKMLNYAVVSFIGVLILVILFQWRSAPSYALSAEEMQTEMQDEANLVMPGELKAMLDDGSSMQYLLIKMCADENRRYPGFGKEMHIPFASILDDESIRIIKETPNVLLISEYESESVIALNLLKSQGINHVRAISNNYAFHKGVVEQGHNPAYSTSHTEKARWDYNRFFKNESAGGAKKSGAPAQIPAAVKVVKASGGC